MRYVARLTVSKQPLESSLHILDDALFHQKTRKMSAPYQFRVAGESPRAFAAARYAETVQRRDHFIRTFGPPGACRREPSLQLQMCRVNTKADDMDGLAIPGHGYFDAIDKNQSMAPRCGARNREPAGVVVIGEGKYAHAALGGPPYQFIGSESTIGKRGVTMQVDVIQVGRAFIALLCASEVCK